LKIKYKQNKYKQNSVKYQQNKYKQNQYKQNSVKSKQNECKQNKYKQNSALSDRKNRILFFLCTKLRGTSRSPDGAHAIITEPVKV
jgi:hypothetical protein